MIIRKLEALFTINTNAAQFRRATEQLDQFSHKVGDIMQAVAGYWAVDSLRNFVLNTAKAMSEIGKNAKFLGITTDALQELRYAAEKSGLSIDGLEDALKELQIRSEDARSGSGEAFEAFAKLGIRSIDSAGKIKAPLDLLVEVADQLQKLPTHAEKIWVTDSMFGDEGGKILMMLQDGSSGLIKLRKEAQALGLVVDKLGIQKASKFNAALIQMRALAGGAGNAFTQGLLGPLTWLMEKFSSLSLAFNKLEGRASLVRVTLMALGGAVAAVALKAALVVAPLVAPFLPLIAGITAASIVVEDLWGAFKGRDSLIGGIVSSISKSIMAFASEASEALTKGFKEAFASINKEFARFSEWLIAGFDRLARTANEFIADLVPDFFKQGFSASMRHIIPEGNTSNGHQRLNNRLGPEAPNIAHQQKYSNTNNVSVAVNVKSNANAPEIGSEVSKAVRKELERERFNAFMGVMHYAA
jgi:TP901 family phage tail tape measure protein